MSREIGLTPYEQSFFQNFSKHLSAIVREAEIDLNVISFVAHVCYIYDFFAFLDSLECKLNMLNRS